MMMTAVGDVDPIAATPHDGQGRRNVRLTSNRDIRSRATTVPSGQAEVNHEYAESAATMMVALERHAYPRFTSAATSEAN
jgi:hypothetical protein